MSRNPPCISPVEELCFAKNAGSREQIQQRKRDEVGKSVRVGKMCERKVNCPELTSFQNVSKIKFLQFKLEEYSLSCQDEV